MTLKQKIQKICNRYGVKVLKVVRYLQDRYDILLDINIYYKAQAKMCQEIRELGNINNIDYRDVA